jgi:hypothetical protein
VRALLGGVGLIAACFSEPTRPAPPLISVSLAKTTVRSPDTLNGTVQVTDADGIDSVWLAVDSAPFESWDGAFATAFTSSFRVLIARGLSPGDRLPVTVSATDVTGFEGEVDTAVTVTVTP